MREKLRPAAALGVVFAVLALVAACGSSKGGGGGGSTATSVGEHSILPPVTHSKPVTGGTLKIVGSGDVDHLDTCCAYYTTTYELLRMVSRQLVSYAAKPGNPSASQVPVPDLATWSISGGGTVYTFHIKPGVMWDAPSGPRQITSQDEVLGLKRLCNPVSPAPPLPYWTNNIAGMRTYCDTFTKLKMPSSPSAEVTALKNFMNTHNISGLSTPNSSTIKITLAHPSSSFINIMAMPMSSPVPAEINNYVPASVTEEEHFISDGPYTITHYTPNVSYTLVDDPAWKQSTDNLRHQYFKKVSITMGESATTVQQQLETGDADLEWDTTVPSADVPGLVANHSKQFVAGFIGGAWYLAYNMKSTTQGGALRKVAVRQALEYCINKRHIVQVSGGPAVNVPSNQILPPQLFGFKALNPYPTPNNEGSPSKCKSMLRKAGYPHGLTLTLAYANNPPNPAQSTALQSDFALGGVTLKLAEQPSQGEYFVYLENPANLKHWDIAWGGWFPDWQGNAAQTYFSPLLDGRQYTTGSTDYGDYNDPVLDHYIDTALSTASVSKATSLWQAADKYVMTKNPPWIPVIYQALPQFVGKNVVGATYFSFIGYVDPTTLWKK
jgi:peptide/nickel transport system substrate-binding protein